MLQCFDKYYLPPNLSTLLVAAHIQMSTVWCALTDGEIFLE